MGILTTTYESSTSPIRSSDHKLQAVNGNTQYFNKVVPNA
jgi:hypothetical protein